MDEPTATDGVSDTALSRDILVRHSMRCLACGVVSVLPVIGLPFGIAALVTYCRTSLRFAGDWNPTRPQLLAGLWLGTFSLLEHAFIATAVAILVADEAGIL